MPADDDTAMVEAIDFALAVYRDDGEWVVARLDAERLTSLDALVADLRRYPGETGVIGMVSVDEDFFVLARVQGPIVRYVVSDITAADDWPLAHDVADELGIDVDDIDPEAQEAAGDLAIFADLGLSAMDLGALCDDDDAFPDELLEEIAGTLGFASGFTDAVESEG